MWQHDHAIRLLFDPLPGGDGEEHAITGVTVYPASDYFTIGFESEGGTLRIRMPADQLARLGKVLIQLAEERRLAGDV
jgi:hypothetical protein